MSAQVEPNHELDAYQIEHDEGVLSEDERLAFQAGLAIGARQERRRILTDLDAVIASSAPLMVEGTPQTRAMAAALGALRKSVEGRQ